MLEGRSCLISRALPSSCEHESKWVYMTCRLMESSNCKRGLEDEGEEELLGERKSSKRLDTHEGDGMDYTPQDLSLSLAFQSDQLGHKRDQTDTNTKLRLQLDGEEELLVERKSSKPLEMNKSEEMTLFLHDLNLPPAGQYDQQGHDWDQGDVNFKRLLEYEGEEEQFEEIRSSKGVDMNVREEAICSLYDMSMSPSDQSVHQGHGGDQWDVNCKWLLEYEWEEEQLGERRSSGRMNMKVREETICNLHDISMSPSDQSVQQGHDGDQADTSSLIQPLGRDISINCLLRCSRSDYNLLASLNRSFRSLIREGELYRLRRKMGVIEHWVYFSCHVLEWEAFDPICGGWMHLPRMPSNDCFMCSDKESLAVGTELLVFGKEITSHVIWRYSILTNSWSSGMKMNAPRCLFGSASLGEIAILAGGCDSQGKVLNTVELYNSETGTWEILPSMNKPRKMCSGVFMDGKFYVIGGTNSKVLSCGEEYNLETRTWREIPDMFPQRNEPTEAPPLVAVVNNELYAADYAEKEVRKYDKETISWITVGKLPERAVSVNGWGLAFRACGEHLIVIGGPRTSVGGMIELNSWVPREGPPQWNLLASKHSASFVYNCAVMGC